MTFQIVGSWQGLIFKKRLDFLPTDCYNKSMLNTLKGKKMCKRTEDDVSKEFYIELLREREYELTDDFKIEIGDKLSDLLRKEKAAKRINKLVRDRIPDIIKSQGREPIVKQLGRDKFIEALNDKLTEEVEEYFEDRNIEELADITEVVLSLAMLQGYDEDEFFKVIEKKRYEKGSFMCGYFYKGDK